MLSIARQELLSKRMERLHKRSYVRSGRSLLQQHSCASLYNTTGLAQLMTLVMLCEESG